MHTARIWMALAIPGGAPGYDYDKEFGNNITHSRSQTSQRLRGLYPPAPGSQGKDVFSAISGSVATFRPFGEREFTLPAMRGLAHRRYPGARVKRAKSRDSGSGPSDHPGMTVPTHPLVASGATHSNSGS